MDFWFYLLVAWFLYCLWDYADSTIAIISYGILPRPSWRSRPTPEQLVEFPREFQVSGAIGTLTFLLHSVATSFAALTGIAHYTNDKRHASIYIMVSTLSMVLSSKINRWCAKRLKERPPEQSS